MKKSKSKKTVLIFVGALAAAGLGYVVFHKHHNKKASEERAKLFAIGKAQLKTPTYEKADADLVSHLISSGTAAKSTTGGGYDATSKTTPEQRRKLAAAECRRAIDVYGMPADDLDDCINQAQSGYPGYQFMEPYNAALIHIYINTQKGNGPPPNPGFDKIMAQIAAGQKGKDKS